MSKKAYPIAKKMMWEAWRAFIPVFMATIFAQFEAGVDLSDWKAWVPSLILASISAGVRAALKRLRANAKDYGSIWYMIPA